MKRHYGYLLPDGGLNEIQIERLSKLLNKSKKTITVKSINNIDWNEISRDGHGYVILKDGTLVEFEEEQ